MTKTIGILGAGQLARMLALAAHELGVKTICYDANDTRSAAAVTQTVEASFEDKEQLLTWANHCDVITYETESIPLAATEFLASQNIEVYPSRRALAMMQNRNLEKTFCRQLGIQTAEFALVKNEEELRRAVSLLGYPCVLKTTTQGYDGKGQYRLENENDVNNLILSWENHLGAGPGACPNEYILEQWLTHEGECSLLSVRDHDGDIRHYPLTYNQHQHGMLAYSRAPYPDHSLQKKAKEIATRILEHFTYVGVLAIEFFIVGNDLLINEMAPRVHNSFHWTIEGAATSQFANHIRALLHWPLGATEAIATSHLFNCIGQLPVCERILSHPGAYYHDYGKIARPGRKLGHVTWCDFNDPGDTEIATALWAEINNIYN
ncbi:MAG: purK [Gammaproteobacteria bacterium]|nr:purK [Gammaproteobacteria bacterium]